MQVSESEAVVMDVLWERGALGADEVVAALEGRYAWAEPTIKTLLNRLLNKGAIEAVREGRRYRYSAVLKREDWLAHQSDGLLDRLFGGRVAPLVAHFGERNRLSSDDIAELRRLVEKLEDGHGRD